MSTNDPQYIIDMLHSQLFQQHVDKVVEVAREQGVSVTQQQAREIHSLVMSDLNDQYKAGVTRYLRHL